MTNKKIAYRLGISTRTFHFHLNSIFYDGGIESRIEVVMLALRSGWIKHAEG